MMKNRITKLTVGAVLMAQLGVFTGCSAPAPVRDGPNVGARIVTESSDARLGMRAASLATELLGSPYRYGGAAPSGFDCSGLVYYVYQQLGREIPRTSYQQYRMASEISGKAESGDVAFFRINRRVSHVGILIDQNTFVHAPKRGRVVELTQLNDPYWQLRLVKIGRFE